MSEGHRIAAQLRAAVDEGVALCSGVSDDRTSARPPSGGWCAREVVGHLIDSASNNHVRFIVNQDAGVETLVVQSYEQQDWVSLGCYRDTPAAELIMLWAAYNRQLARMLEAMPDAVLTRPRGSLTGHSFPYTDVSGEFATLGHLADDYVGHIRHHLQQIRRLLTGT